VRVWRALRREVRSGVVVGRGPESTHANR
jgi:hypothetical protein